MKGKLTKSSTGITLIALVITIIVLLILAGVSISMVVGQNGILSNAQNSVIADAKAKEEEGVQRSALAAISISSSKGNIALENGYFNQELKNEFGEGNYLLEEQTDKFIVTIVETGNSYEIDKVGNVSGQVPPEENAGESGWEGFYADADTQPTDPTHFTYQIISEEDKTIAITGIKSQYIPLYYYNDLYFQEGILQVPTKDVELIIPYEIDGYSVKKIMRMVQPDTFYMNRVITVELPKGVEEIGQDAFWSFRNLNTIIIPDTLSVVGDYAFTSCGDLQAVKYGGTQEEWDSITLGSVSYNLTDANLILNYTGE